jgi:hypothetical protein
MFSLPPTCTLKLKTDPKALWPIVLLHYGVFITNGQSLSRRNNDILKKNNDILRPEKIEGRVPVQVCGFKIGILFIPFSVETWGFRADNESPRAMRKLGGLPPT